MKFLQLSICCHKSLLPQITVVLCCRVASCFKCSVQQAVIIQTQRHCLNFGPIKSLNRLFCELLGNQFTIVVNLLINWMYNLFCRSFCCFFRCCCCCCCCCGARLKARLLWQTLEISLDRGRGCPSLRCLFQNAVVSS